MAKNEEKDVKTSSKKETKKKNTLKSNEVKKVAKVTKKETISKKKSNIEKKEKTKISDTTSSKKTSSTHRKIKPTAKPMLAEYYDLPYRYNQTIVKILAQTPSTLFVYWDISDEDKNSLIKAHGENFFYVTRPILVIHNITKNYSFEIEINDFANSWYIRTRRAKL
ncbi:MAG: DUF4912 domain-containing protein [Clostridia bacterium]|nr:DUF4912 domain-containing protein [Clostridia bacterium]